MQASANESNATATNDVGATGGGSRTVKAAKRRTPTSTIKGALAARKAFNLKKKWQTEKQQKHSAATLRSRLNKLRDLGVMPGQIADIMELSYAGARGITDGDLNPHPEKLTKYHERITAWCARVAKV